MLSKAKVVGVIAKLSVKNIGGRRILFRGCLNILVKQTSVDVDTLLKILTKSLAPARGGGRRREVIDMSDIRVEYCQKPMDLHQR